MSAYTLTFPCEPVSINSAYECQDNRLRSSKLAKMLRKNMNNFVQLSHDPQVLDMKRRVRKDPKENYALIIRMFKRPDSDYSNFGKLIEDCMHRLELTPDDRYAIMAPIILSHMAPAVGFRVTVIYKPELKQFYDLVKNGPC